MELDISPTLPCAHQQIRLADLQASAQKWSRAIEHYLRAIDVFRIVQNTLSDLNLISIIEAQILQCEKSIHLCRLKDRSEQTMKEQQAERLSKLTRAHSTSQLKSPGKSIRMLARHHTFQIDSPVLLDDHDASLTVVLSKQIRIMAKKNKKHDAQKIEELQMSYEALRTHLKVAFDDIERLKSENKQLRVQKEIHPIEEQNQSSASTNSHEDEPTETELEATL